MSRIRTMNEETLEREIAFAVAALDGSAETRHWLDALRAEKSRRVAA